MRTVEGMIKHFKQMVEKGSSTFMLEEVKWQYQDMAQGGDGGELYGLESGGQTCRSYNYPGYPNEFFLRVCKGMGWL